MNPDTVFVMGMFIAVFSVPSMVSAWSDGHVPRVASVVAMLGGGMMVWAHTQKPGGYRFDDVPDLIVRVVGQFF